MIAVTLNILTSSLALAQAQPDMSQASNLEANSFHSHAQDNCDSPEQASQYTMRQRVVIVSQRQNGQAQVIERRSRTQWGCAPERDETQVRMTSEGQLVDYLPDAQENSPYQVRPTIKPRPHRPN